MTSSDYTCLELEYVICNWITEIEKDAYISFGGHRDLKNTEVQYPAPKPPKEHTLVGWMVMVGRTGVALFSHLKFEVLKRKNFSD